MAIGRTFQRACKRLCARSKPAHRSRRDRNRASIRATTRTPFAPRSARPRRRRAQSGAGHAARHERSRSHRCRIDRGSGADSRHRRHGSRNPAPKACRRRRRCCAGSKPWAFRRAARPAHRRRRRGNLRAPPQARRAAGVQAHRYLRRRIRFATATCFDYQVPFAGRVADEAAPTDKKKVIILGGGPNRIGQGIEFDYCCCHAAFALKEVGYETS